LLQNVGMNLHSAKTPNIIIILLTSSLSPHIVDYNATYVKSSLSQFDCKAPCDEKQKQPCTFGTVET
jgi:hypothetical protein